MKKVFVRFFVTIIILAVVGGSVFMWGWVPFWVPAGSHGVLLSKSGGYYSQSIESGTFLWRWERLLPTNASLFVFELKSVFADVSKQETLPSARVYNSILDTPIDFSWHVSFNASAKLTAAALVDTVKQEGLKTQSDMDAFIQRKISEAGERAVYTAVNEYLRTAYAAEYGVMTEHIRSALTTSLAPAITLDTFTIKNIHLPDTALYSHAKKNYDDYQSQKDALLAEVRAKEAALSVAEQLQLNRLERWADFLNRYPKIIELLAVARDDAARTMEVLNEVQKNSSAKPSPSTENKKTAENPPSATAEPSTKTDSTDKEQANSETP